MSSGWSLESDGMILRIEYYQEGSALPPQPWSAASPKEAIAHAKRQMLFLGADRAKIINDDDESELWSGGQDA